MRWTSRAERIAVPRGLIAARARSVVIDPSAVSGLSGVIDLLDVLSELNDQSVQDVLIAPSGASGPVVPARE